MDGLIKDIDAKITATSSPSVGPTKLSQMD